MHLLDSAVLAGIEPTCDGLTIRCSPVKLQNNYYAPLILHPSGQGADYVKIPMNTYRYSNRRVPPLTWAF